jgi:putative flavoprotein involved in K+ transport
MPYPPSWPTYIPKDMLAGWFEAYVEGMELNYWPATEFEGGTYDEAEGRWRVVLRRSDGSTRQMRPRHVVMANGVSCIPNIPDIPTLDRFRGPVLHSSRYGDGESWAGKSAIVIGTGNSGHDIAQDLYSSGAKVTLVQRSPTLIVNIEPSAQLPYALYDEGPPLEDCDLIAASMPLPLARKGHIAMTARARQLDKQLLDRLERVGCKLEFGEDGSGRQCLSLTRGGGYYFNVGCSDLIAARKIGPIQFSDIAEFTADGALCAAATSFPPTWSFWRRATRDRRLLLPSCSAMPLPSASAPSGASAMARSCATCSRARRSLVSGSSPAAWPSAASTPSTSPSRSRPARRE